MQNDRYIPDNSRKTVKSNTNKRQLNPSGDLLEHAVLNFNI